ncbi:serine-enriched protein-like [Gigantopelta aegis]|uniref:serine-enriched protein-like n=1 Tax=Gigantopelta aegis TaxID=1735272 RepID=UPI001B88D0AE|nr:serine-enriched protein-like [Gigantopelta aegis]
MDRYNSNACLLDSDVFTIVHGGEEEYSFSSGYESSDSSDDVSDKEASPSGLGCPGEMMFFSSTSALCNSLEFIITMPEMCNVTFLVGRSRVPVHGVKAILATRSRLLYQLILQHQREADRQSAQRSRSHRHRSVDQLIIPMEDYREEEFYRLVKFLHSGKIRIDLKVVVGKHLHIKMTMMNVVVEIL